MDLPRGGKRLRFDQPLTGYHPARRQRLYPPIPSQPVSTAASSSRQALLPSVRTVRTDPPLPQRVQPPSDQLFSTTAPTRSIAPTQPILPSQPIRPIYPTRPTVPSQSEVIPTQLIENHKRRQTATECFPQEISDSCIRGCLARYEDHISSIIKSTEKICGSCGRFIEQHVLRLPELDLLLQPFRVDTDSSLRLDSCAKNGSDYLFCKPCYISISQKRPPKYSALNGVNVTFCQSYPGFLQELTLVEECLIARSHPIASIVKLRPQRASYDRLRGHVVILPQEPGPLLEILPSADLNLVEKIKVIWFGDRTPTTEDLKPYLEVRKLIVFRTLQWLRLHNKLYSYITVNETLLASWEDSFIPHDLEESIVHSESDRDEHEGYTADLQVGNYENDFQEALDSQSSAPISTGCVYTDVESSRQHPALQLVSAILNLERDRFERDAPPLSNAGDSVPHYIDDVYVIRYVSRGRSILMNDWQDSEFFTGSFPTLFPLGSGGHLADPQERPVPVSLQAWAKWALSHHSRRYVSNLNTCFFSVSLNFTVLLSTTLFYS
jgi:hypothetical protein